MHHFGRYACGMHHLDACNFGCWIGSGIDIRPSVRSLARAKLLRIGYCNLEELWSCRFQILESKFRMQKLGSKEVKVHILVFGWRPPHGQEDRLTVVSSISYNFGRWIGS